MKETIFNIAIHTMVFWIVTDIFEGIVVSGLIFYLILGGVWGIISLWVERLIRFFTLPENSWTVIGICAGLGIITFTAYNFGSVGIDFTHTVIDEFSNEYVTFNTIELGMVGNIVGGGIMLGIFSGILKELQE